MVPDIHEALAAFVRYQHGRSFRNFVANDNVSPGFHQPSGIIQPKAPSFLKFCYRIVNGGFKKPKSE